MKNIHVLPTDKPSRLFEIIQFNLSFDNQNMYSEEYKKLHKYKNKNIYITSDEEIKASVYCLINKVLCKTELLEGRIVSRQLSGGGTMDICKTEYLEIILTTDQDLIKDGVQSIDDEFLECFVKNPSCESVEIKTFIKTYEDGYSFDKLEYKIIIPKEEPKGFIPDGNWNDEEEVQVSDYDKQETLEEVAELESVENKCVAGCKHFYGKEVKHHKDCFYYPESFSKMYDDLEWQQEPNKNKYSEEIVNILDNVRYWETCPDSYKVIIERFIEQKKNK